MGIFYALSALATWTYAWFVALAAVLYLVVRVPWWGERRRLGPLVRSGLIAIVVALVPVVPFALPYVLATAGGAVISRPLEEAQAFSASVADFIIPSAFHPLWGQWVIQNWRSGNNGIWLSEWQVYVGFVALAMALVGFVAHRNRLALALGIMAAGSFVIALGPSLYLTHPQPLNGVTARAALSPIPLPVDALAQIPPFKFQRGWARMGFFVELAVGLLAAGGLAALLQALSQRYGSRARNLQWTLTLGILSLTVLDGLSIPIGMADINPRPVDTWLAQQSEQSIVMEYPMSNSYQGAEMYWTRQTGKRTIMGYASYPPNQDFWGVLSRFPGARCTQPPRRLGC